MLPARPLVVVIGASLLFALAACKSAQDRVVLKRPEPIVSYRLVRNPDLAPRVSSTPYGLTPLRRPPQLSMVMDARPYKFLARIVTPLIKGMVTKAVVADMDGVKAWCEREAGGS